MANWESLRLTDVIEKIQNDEIVLPVIQRNLVWKEEKIELLFDTLLKGDSFGGIMTLKDFRDNPPLFDFRYFIRDFKDNQYLTSNEVDKLQQDISYVIDGQQRLQAFYIGLIGTYNNRLLYFDLKSDDEYNFRFGKNQSDLPEKVDSVNEVKRDTFWYDVRSLYKDLKTYGGDEDDIFDSLIKRFSGKLLPDDSTVRKNVKKLAKEIFTNKNLGICEVAKSRKTDDVDIRQEVVELFRRLNQGGTKLSALDLAASKLKGYNSKVETFLNETQEYFDIGFGQDELIKLVFILQDNSKKTLATIEQVDAEFIVRNEDRIKKSLAGTRKFLEYSNFYRFFVKNQPSIIPLYFIAYHLFHKEISNNELPKYFDDFETTNLDFKKIHRWIYLSLLNRTFRRKGAGWTTYTTGIRKILGTIDNYKNQLFPVNEIFNVYKQHPIVFDEEIKIDNLDNYDKDFLLYIIYDMPKDFRENDIDHIHPKSLLEKDFEWDKINSIINYQLLNQDKNRGEKNNNELEYWINNRVDLKEDYLKIHLIPEDETLWKSENFISFLNERGKKITEKLKNKLT